MAMTPASFIVTSSAVYSQDKLRMSCAATGATNAIWYIVKERGFYKKNGLDVMLLFIPSTIVIVAALLAEDVPIGMAGGRGVANAAVRGSDLQSVACFINTLDFDLVVHASLPSAAALKGKTVGISRFGSISDVAARELIKGLGLNHWKTFT